jgi:hypothetical protein
VDDRVWRNVSIVLGVICALLIGVAGALMIVGHRNGTPSDTTPPGVATASATPGETSLASGEAPASPGATPTTAGPTPTQGPASPATITFNGLGLDSGNGASSTARTFTFTSDGPGPVTFALTKISTGGTAKLCINVDGGAFACKVGTPSKLPSFPSGKADTAHSTWSATVIGYGSSAPTVDLTFTWPSAGPKVLLTHGRFQGSPAALAGFTATFKPRAAGQLNVQAQWSVNADASMTLYDATSSPAVTVDQRNYSAVTNISPAFTTNVDPTKTYQVKLLRTSADTPDQQDLTAQVIFP